MRLNYLFTIAAALFLVQPIQAQDTGQAKIGVVDMNKLINESPQAQDMQSAIEEEFAPRVRDITAKESAFNTGRENLTKDKYDLFDIFVKIAYDEKPKLRKPIKTYSKLESKINDIIKFIKKEIKAGNQIFWVCPLIEESKKLDHSSAIKKFEYLEKLFPNQVSLLHGKTDIEEKEIILNRFLKNEFKILVSTTIIEVGIDFPNANVIIIENANKFGLSQLHQLRGRVGRGNKNSTCILMFKSNLSENAKKRINILKNSNDGFYISEEDMKIRGFGDILGFKQSGIKNFKLADPIHNNDLFLLAEKEMRRIEQSNEDIGKFKPLIKLYDRADIINDIA